MVLGLRASLQHSGSRLAPGLRVGIRAPSISPGWHRGSGHPSGTAGPGWHRRSPCSLSPRVPEPSARRDAGLARCSQLGLVACFGVAGAQLVAAAALAAVAVVGDVGQRVGADQVPAGHRDLVTLLESSGIEAGIHRDAPQSLQSRAGA